MRWFLLVAVVALAAGPDALGAQRLDASRFRMVDTGALVRIGVTERVRRQPYGEPVEQVRGTVRGITPDTLYLEQPGSAGPIAIPRGRIQGVKMSLGPPSRWASAREYGWNGAVLLGVLGMLWRGDAATTGAAAGVGLVGGALVGFISPDERWRVAWLPE